MAADAVKVCEWKKYSSFTQPLSLSDPIELLTEEAISLASDWQNVTKQRFY
jgi:hypothetical protein